MTATRRLLFSTMVVLAGASIASADLFHYFPIEEGAGNTTANLGTAGGVGTVQSPGNGLGIAGDHWVLNGTRGAVNRGTVLSGNDNNGSSSHVTTTGVPSATYNGSWTQTIWAAVDGTGNDVVLGHRFGGPGGFAKLDTNNFEWQAPGGGGNTGPGTGTDGLWHQYTIVKNGNQIQSFRDGVANGGPDTRNGTFGGVTVPYNLFGDGGERPGGLYDEVGFFDEALSAEKVTAMYNLGDTTQNAGYGLLDIDNIFGVFDDGGEYETPDGLTWMQATGLNGGAGVLVDNGDSFEIQLDSAGNGVVGSAVIPEPTTIAICSLLGACATFFAYRRSRRQK